MRELANFQVDKHVAPEQAVVEHQIDEEVLFVEGEPLCRASKRNPFPNSSRKFSMWVTMATPDRTRSSGLLFNAEKLQHVRVLSRSCGWRRAAPAVPVADRLLVAAESQPLIEAASNWRRIRAESNLLAASIS